MRVALVHDWLTGMRGGEKVLEALCRLFPEAELYTLVHRRGWVSPLIEHRRVHRSIVDRFPLAGTRIGHYEIIDVIGAGDGLRDIPRVRALRHGACHDAA